VPGATGAGLGQGVAGVVDVSLDRAPAGAAVCVLVLDLETEAVADGVDTLEDAGLEAPA
jgi:hypothetical protein